MDIGDTTEETVNVNETIHEAVEETEPAENAEITECNQSRSDFYFHLS